ERAATLARHDDPGALELEKRALDGDDADARARRERPDRRNLLARQPIADGNAAPYLLDELQIHGPAVCLRDGELTVHIEIHSIHRMGCLASAGPSGSRATRKTSRARVSCAPPHFAVDYLTSLRTRRGVVVFGSGRKASENARAGAAFVNELRVVSQGIELNKLSGV